MTSLIVEDGTIVANSNTYIDTTYLATFCSDRGITLTGNPTTLIRESMDAMENYVYKGVKRTLGQTLQWPRVDVYIDTYYLQANTLPTQLLLGQAWTCVAIDQGTDTLQDLTRRTKREKVGTIEVEYVEGSQSNNYNIHIHNAMWKILDNGSGTGLRIGKG